MMNEKLQAAFNDQINKELYSEYLYLAMKIYFLEQNLNGFANWFDVQVQEERAHAMGLFDYLNDREGTLKLEAIDKPVVEGNTPVAIFEQVLKHEKFVTERISALMDVADEAHDRAALSFLDWYIKEQVEEEATASTILGTLRLIGDDKKGLLMLDRELAARTFTAPTIG